MTFLDFPPSLEQSMTRTWQSQPLCQMNLRRDIFICPIDAAQRTPSWEEEAAPEAVREPGSAATCTPLLLNHSLRLLVCCYK